jgi:serine protease Do
MEDDMANAWKEFSKDVSQAVERAGRSVVAVDGRSGHTSSGIVWRDGFVLTAAHSVRQDASIRVHVEPEHTVSAQLLGRDRGTDIAVLKLDGQVEAEPAQFGNAASLVIGEFTVAVARTRRGNIVASGGMISGLMGEWRIGRTRIDQFIRPDLNLYPGFSGGALADSAGAVMGLNTSGLVRGKAITIPSSTLSRIAEEITAKGHVTQPYIGLVMQPVPIPESLRQRADVSAAAGLLVMHVEPAGPADAGGALLGDILIDMDGRGFEDLDDVQEVIGKKNIGDEVLTTLIRGGQKSQIRIRLGERPLR